VGRLSMYLTNKEAIFGIIKYKGVEKSFFCKIILKLIRGKDISVSKFAEAPLRISVVDIIGLTWHN